MNDDIPNLQALWTSLFNDKRLIQGAVQTPYGSPLYNRCAATLNSASTLLSDLAEANGHHQELHRESLLNVTQKIVETFING